MKPPQLPRISVFMIRKYKDKSRIELHRRQLTHQKKEYSSPAQVFPLLKPNFSYLRTPKGVMHTVMYTGLKRSDSRKDISLNSGMKGIVSSVNKAQYGNLSLVI
jgi:hypothetical protein